VLREGDGGGGAERGGKTRVGFGPLRPFDVRRSGHRLVFRGLRVRLDENGVDAARPEVDKGCRHQHRRQADPAAEHGARADSPDEEVRPDRGHPDRRRRPDPTASVDLDRHQEDRCDEEPGDRRLSGVPRGEHLHHRDQQVRATDDHQRPVQPAGAASGRSVVQTCVREAGHGGDVRVG
jgi:hypothetical protein